ncbi:MAG: helix-hairpin-helix domain-containing protein [Candidatus Aminicenantes bacterium]|nr:helix-hairpin-helix domain-containing protein [Candidatus Aminicenantes bacterium]
MKNRICCHFVFSLVVLGLLLGSLAMPAGAAAKAKKINLNTATLAKLEALKGVGPSLAQKIIAARPFKSIADLKNVSGIGQAKFDDLKDLVTVEAAEAAKTAETATKAKAKTETAAKGNDKTVAGEIVNLNTADEAAIENLPGIGSTLAENIIAARPFKNVDDLKNVKGIGQATFDKLKDLVTVKAAKAGKKIESEAKAAAKQTSPAAKQSTAAGPVDLNSADKAALEALPGIGPELAEKIIAARPFKNVEDIKNVSGIGQARFDDIKNLVTVEADDETAVSPKLKPGETININKASEEQLDGLLGIGPVKAKAIIAGRPYAKIEDIMKVKGIKEKTFAKIKEYIVVR